MVNSVELIKKIEEEKDLGLESTFVRGYNQGLDKAVQVVKIFFLNKDGN